LVSTGKNVKYFKDLFKSSIGYYHKLNLCGIHILVQSMVREKVLRAIKDAEKAASETLSDAKKEAASILSQARQGASEILNSERSNAESTNQKLVSNARESANSEAKLVSDGGNVAQQSVHDSGKKNRTKAEKIVIDAFKK
tara:strand:+ start:816 stop:1238 length:423 start_codon:yes stop_codon:yes gene_type:complete